MKRLHWILLLMILLIPTESISAKKKTEKSDREIWCDVMYRMAAPVLSNMSEGLLKQNMLVELIRHGTGAIRTSLIWNASVV